jgi:hypothetical protein
MTYYARRKVIAVIAGVIFAISGCYWCWLTFFIPIERNSAVVNRLRESLNRLASKRPENVTRKQWEFMIGWTQNGIGNCFGVYQSVKDPIRFAGMPDELEWRIDHDPGVSVIDWIWDEMEANSTYGPSYSESWRPTRPDRLEDADHTTV